MSREFIWRGFHNLFVDLTLPLSRVWEIVSPRQIVSIQWDFLSHIN